MAEHNHRFRRPDMHARTRRDIARFRRRESGGRFWRSLTLIGSVGWPIVLLSTGGALLGSTLDQRLGTGIRFTLTLLAVGTVLGCFMAYRTLRGGGA